FVQGTTTGTASRINAGVTFTITFPNSTDLSKVTSISYYGSNVTSFTAVTGSPSRLTFTTPVAVPTSTTFAIVVSNVPSPTVTTTTTYTTTVPNSVGGT